MPSIIWVSSYGEEYEERLLCRQNSKLARKMVDHHLEWKNRKAYRMLVGIAAHVYADTFAHYGFSGIPSDWNEVKLKSLEVESKEVLGESLLDYVTGKLGKLVKEAGDRVKAQVAETASWGLGHGGAATYPDRPYMVWSFEYENTAHGERRGRKARDNPRTFLVGAKALHAMFQRVRETGKVASDGEGKEWKEIRAIVKRVIETPGEEDTRIKTRRKAARAGGLFEHEGEAISAPGAREAAGRAVAPVSLMEDLSCGAGRWHADHQTRVQRHPCAPPIGGSCPSTERSGAPDEPPVPYLATMSLDLLAAG